MIFMSNETHDKEVSNAHYHSAVGALLPVPQLPRETRPKGKSSMAKALIEVEMPLKFIAVATGTHG